MRVPRPRRLASARVGVGDSFRGGEAVVVRRNVRLGRVWERRAPALVAAAVALAVAAPVAAAAPGYVSEMPSAAEVLAKVSHGDRVDTWARRYATFERLVGILG